MQHNCQREKAPVFTLGSPDARSFSRGKRGIAGNLSFAVLDRDALVEEMKNIWHQIAPKAMFTAAGNASVRASEDFSNALDMVNWNKTASEAAQGSFLPGGGDYGFSGTGAITPGTKPGSNDMFNPAKNSWEPSKDQIHVPPGFTPLRGNNVQYADTLPPIDLTLTFNIQMLRNFCKRVWQLITK